MLHHVTFGYKEEYEATVHIFYTGYYFGFKAKMAVQMLLKSPDVDTSTQVT